MGYTICKQPHVEIEGLADHFAASCASPMYALCMGLHVYIRIAAIELASSERKQAQEGIGPLDFVIFRMGVIFEVMPPSSPVIFRLRAWARIFGRRFGWLLFLRSRHCIVQVFWWCHSEPQNSCRCKSQ